MSATIRLPGGITAVLRDDLTWRVVGGDPEQRRHLRDLLNSEYGAEFDPGEYVPHKPAAAARVAAEALGGEVVAVDPPPTVLGRVYSRPRDANGCE